MPSLLCRLSALLVFTLLTFSLPAQNVIKVFTDGPVDRAMMLQQLNYVDHTIDPSNAQVHVFIARQSLGSRGLLYKYDLTGKGDLEGNQLAFDLMCDNNMTGIEIDQAIISRLELGLAGLLAGTEYAPHIGIEIGEEMANKVAVPDSLETNVDAPEEFDWNNWIFEVFGNLRYRTESFRTNLDLRTGLRIDRSTPELRIRIDPRYNYFTQTVTTTNADGEKVDNTSFRERIAIWSSVVKSISDHWSVGLFASAEHHSFINIDLGTWVAPAIEYNFFSYDEVPFKEFTAAYRIGWVHNRYLEETVFLQTEEDLGRHLLDIDLRLRQKWGSLFTGISAGAYLNDIKMNRFSFDARCDVRVLKGLSVNVGGSYEIINDQINLPRGEATLEEILLGQTQLATNFQADLRFGLSYTFGSPFNNVVNTRL